jgi:DNA-binding response OmpR family regulator
MEFTKPSILCIDDDEDTRDLIKFALQSMDYSVATCATAEEGLIEARKGGFGAIILDNRFRDSRGEEICRRIRRFDADTPIVFYSGEARPAEIDKAFAAGANAYLVKPLGFEKLAETVTGLIEKGKNGGGDKTSTPPPGQLK